MNRTIVVAGLLAVAGTCVAKAPAARRNVIIFVADGLRSGSVNPVDAPTMVRLRREGVWFKNSHSLFPTFTTPNASAIATGHYLGDTGDFSNALYVGYPAPGGTNVPFIENDGVLTDIDEHFPGNNFLSEESLLAFARNSGYNTAAVGKLGPTLIQDITQSRQALPKTIIIDDSTGKPGGVPLSEDVANALTAAKLGVVAPGRTNGEPKGSRGDNGASGTWQKPGTNRPNLVQQRFYVNATTKVILPRFKAAGRPFAMVFWSRDPDGSQHNQGDSLNRVTPGINGPTSRAGVHNADNNLAQILDWLRRNNLAASTDVFVTSDHGFSTISRHDVLGGTVKSYATGFRYNDVAPGFLPPGFVAIDLAHALGLPIYDPDQAVGDSGGDRRYQLVSPAKGEHPRNGSGLLGGTGQVSHNDAEIVVAANGGSDLVYVPGRGSHRVRAVVNFLTRQTYVDGIFVDDSYGRLPGTLPLSAVGLEGSTVMPRPAIVVAFKTFLVKPGDLQSEVTIADTGLQQGQGMHGSFGRSDTYNTMIAYGPDFKKGFVDPAPAGNADIVPTLAGMLGFHIPAHGKLRGRPLTEARLHGAAAPTPTQITRRSSPAANGFRTVMVGQTVGGTPYFGAAHAERGTPR